MENHVSFEPYNPMLSDDRVLSVLETPLVTPPPKRCLFLRCLCCFKRKKL